MILTGKTSPRWLSAFFRTIVDRVKQDRIKILLISVLMLPSALKIKELKDKLENMDVKIIVGGAPFRFDDQLWREVGADAMCKNASEAVSIIHHVIGGNK